MAIGAGGDARAIAHGYRPWLDGVRAVAVLMVVVQHALGEMPVDLGFVGVGIFFALSGYLITSLLLDERSRRGSVSLGSFYLRRFARLVPALVVVVFVCNTIFLLQGHRRPVLSSLFALTYTANYAQVLRDDLVRAYGATWSLAVEEHFYLLWPLLLLGIVRRFNMRAALFSTLAVCLGALAWRGVLTALGAPLIMLSYGSLERADAMLYGCAAAIALRLGWRPQPWMLWVGIAVVASMPIALHEESHGSVAIFGAVLAIAATGLVLGLDHTAPTWLRRALSAPALVRVGILSYGIYLWHGPLMEIAVTTVSESPQVRAVAAVAAVIAAAVSHHFVEAPIRTWARRVTSESPLPLPPA